MKENKVEDPRAFANFVRMDVQQSPIIVHNDKTISDAIPSAERVAVTLRCLATSIVHTLLRELLVDV